MLKKQKFSGILSLMVMGVLLLLLIFSNNTNANAQGLENSCKNTSIPLQCQAEYKRSRNDQETSFCSPGTWELQRDIDNNGMAICCNNHYPSSHCYSVVSHRDFIHETGNSCQQGYKKFIEYVTRKAPEYTESEQLKTLVCCKNDSMPDCRLILRDKMKCAGSEYEAY